MDFLKSSLPWLTGHHVERYKRQIKKVCATFEEDPGVNVQEFIAI